ncbi:insulin receptor substrate 1-B isoform X1 [Tachysurus vachellii]|uniref:insulin receptor substrate 1-B isoform X1 n=1 Tax=Tachysurus vachellii TaxID=175792 RepID=UPI00296ACE17|nr:insulin receptor substrate 1-B isoform X1 [Tachysurus vachellii]
MESEVPSCEDVRKSGYLRKQKSMHRRYFVLRAASERGPARLEYYESEKKFRGGKAAAPKRALALETCFNINKRADAKHKHMIVLYTRAESFAVAADSEADQDEWYRALLELHCKSKALWDGKSGDYGVPSPGPAFKEVWQVKVWPKGLGQAKNLVGIYRLCLTEKTVNFVKLNSDAAAVVLQLMNVRRCGHSENFFFVEVGRSAVTGPGEFWMQVEDSVVAQNMHETLLEAMKALSEEFRQRSKSQSTTAGGGGGATASNPISVPSRRHHPNPPPSQVGFIRRPRTEPPGATGGGGTSNNASPTPRHGLSRACNSSDGAKVEEGMNAETKGVNSSSSPTTNGSCTSTPILRSTSVRAPTPVKAQHALMRSVSTPVSSPAQNPSSYSGNVSEFVGTGTGTTAAGGTGNGSTYKRMPLRQPSVSGSLSDYGSSDEYGSSPGENSLLTTSIQAGSVGSSGGDEAANYIIMAQKGASNSLPRDNSLPQTRRVLRRFSGRECDPERRMVSKRASLPPMALERLGTYRKGGDVEIEKDNYAVMSRSTSRESFSSRQDSESLGGTRYLDLAAEPKVEAGSCGSDGLSITGNGNVGGDNGYMSMLPGVTAPPVSLSHSLSVAVSDTKSADDYMAMTPNNSVSLPQQIHLPNSTTDGYMMMSPNSSCSPDQRLVSGASLGRNSADSRTGSDYMNMSPISVRANSTPSPQGSLTASEKHPQQPPPKMVYSYYSLPRSYKHSSTKYFEDGLGRGKSLGSERGNGGGQGLGSCRGMSYYQESGVGRHLSFSSSSYSSSSASSESLGEGEEKLSQVRKTATGAQVKDSGALPQGLGFGAAKQGQRNRPLSLFVDVSKANTLPRVRETPVPSEPKSPGEYVSIEFKSDRSKKDPVRGPKQGGSIPASSWHPLSRPTSCVAGFLPHSCSPSSAVPSSVASEYVNMELGASPSPSSFSLTPLDFPSFPTPPTPPTLAPKSWDEQRSTPQNEEEAEVEMAHSGHQHLSDSQSLDSPVPCADYTEMVFGLSSDTTTNSTTPKESLLDRQESMVPTLSLGLNLDFPIPKAPNPDHGAKVIRADPQARRRHCSETFLAPSSLSSCPVSSSSSMCMISDHTQNVARRLALDGILSGSGNLLEITNHHENHAISNINSIQTSSTEQGLNYIDLDLATRDSSHLVVDVQTAGQTAARLFSSVLGSGASGGAGGTGGLSSNASNLNTYASIDFYKSEELRSHQGSNSSKDSTGRSSCYYVISLQFTVHYS